MVIYFYDGQTNDSRANKQQLKGELIRFRLFFMIIFLKHIK